MTPSEFGAESDAESDTQPEVRGPITARPDSGESGLEEREVERTGTPEAEDHPALRGIATRLPSSAIGIWVAQSLIGLIPLALVVLVGTMSVRLIVVLVLAFQVGHVLTWLRFTWRLDESSLIIERGLLMRQRRVIPRDRIQTVDLERTLVHRLLGVTEVRVEAIGAGDTEGALPAVEPWLADRLRRELLGARTRTSGRAGAEVTPFPNAAERSAPDGHGEAESSLELERISARNLLLAGVTGGRVGVGAAILGLISQVAPAEWVARILLPGLEQIPDPMSVAGLRLLLFLVGMAFLVGFLTSLIATLLVHWRFTLTRTPTALQVTRGLLTEHRDTVPFRRIQAVRIEENWIRRIFGLASVKVVVAGRAGSSQSAGADLILPIGTRRRAFELAGMVVGLEGVGVPEMTWMPDQARRRRRLRAVVLSLLLGVGGAVVATRVETWSPEVVGPVFAVVALVPSLILAHLAWTGLGWADLGSHVVVREGALTRRWVLLPLSATQELRTVSNPFQRRRDLATLELHIARPVGVLGAPRAVDLSDELAEELRERWSIRLTRTSRSEEVVADDRG
ncbi:MAG: hypothetical protein EA351_09300 [Gemmatimonadales bacterium]|nr:MAG: hypothetical protein EA351_09300 [Gemmatimonadales bacterium]